MTPRTRGLRLDPAQLVAHVEVVAAPAGLAHGASADRESVRPDLDVDDRVGGDGARAGIVAAAAGELAGAVSGVAQAARGLAELLDGDRAGRGVARPGADPAARASPFLDLRRAVR